MKRKVFWVIALILFMSVVAGGWYMFNEIFPKAKPISQRKRKQGEERRMAMEEEVAKL